MSKIYISGPMSNKPQYNFPAFDRVAQRLRDDGFEVINPAEEDGPDVRAACLDCTDGAGNIGQSWGDALARDVKLLCDSEEIEVIALLPGWASSRGAQLEVLIGLQRGFSFLLALDVPEWADDDQKESIQDAIDTKESYFLNVSSGSVADVLAGEIFAAHNSDVFDDLQKFLSEVTEERANRKVLH